MGRSALLLALLATLSGNPVSGQTRAEFDLVLLPLVVNAPGTNDAHWLSRTSAYLSNGQQLRLRFPHCAPVGCAEEFSIGQYAPLGSDPQNEKFVQRGEAGQGECVTSQGAPTR